MNAPVLSVRGLRTRFRTAAGDVQAVDDVSFDLAAGETLALVGESGSGKSVTAMSVLRLVPDPGEIVAGEIRFGGRDLCALPAGKLRPVRGKGIAMVFQEPMTSLNPVLRVGDQVAEAVTAHERVPRREAMARAIAMLERVGIADAARRSREYPHQFSGGMRQRVVLAMALVCRPAVLLADEPTTALDVTLQAQVLDLLRDLRAELGLAVLLVTHDFGVVAEAAERVAVMYAGQIVETAPVAAVFAAPLHPYTAGLLGSRPRLGAGARRLAAIPGAVPDPLRLPQGCRFHPRCPVASARCRAEAPVLAAAGEGREVRCFHPGAAGPDREGGL